MKNAKYVESTEIVEHHPANPGSHYSRIYKGIEKLNGQWFCFIEAQEVDSRIGFVGARYTVKSAAILDIEGFERARTVVLRNLETARDHRRNAPLRALEAHEQKLKIQTENEARKKLAHDMKQLGFSWLEPRKAFKPVGQVKGRGVVISFQSGDAARWVLDCHGRRLHNSFETALAAARFVNQNRGSFNIQINPTSSAAPVNSNPAPPTHEPR